MTGRKLKILIVDDDIDNAASLGELFELYGHDISLVHNGEDAIAAYIGSSFDIAFMDVMMPGKNGVESFLEIRKMKPSAKVVMMTGYSVEQLLRQALDNGAVGVLSKPMDPSQALNLLDDIGPKGMVIAHAAGPGDRNRLQAAIQQAGKSCAVLHSECDMDGFTGGSEDVIIIDIDRPLIEGVACFAELKRCGLNSRAIILADAEQDSECRGDFLQDYRITGILNKPFDPQLLLKSVNQFAL